MLKLVRGKTKNIIAVVALACFLASPISYTVQTSTVSAAAFHHERRAPEPPPPPPKHDKDNDKDYDRGDVTAAVLIGGVIGAVIAKNT